MRADAIHEERIVFWLHSFVLEFFDKIVYGGTHVEINDLSTYFADKPMVGILEGTFFIVYDPGVSFTSSFLAFDNPGFLCDVKCVVDGLPAEVEFHVKNEFVVQLLVGKWSFRREDGVKYGKALLRLAQRVSLEVSLKNQTYVCFFSFALCHYVGRGN